MAQYRATGSIKHGRRWLKAGDVVELPDTEKKSDLFVAVAPKAEKAKESAPVAQEKSSPKVK